MLPLVMKRQAMKSSQKTKFPRVPLEAIKELVKPNGNAPADIGKRRTPESVAKKVKK